MPESCRPIRNRRRWNSSAWVFALHPGAQALIGAESGPRTLLQIVNFGSVEVSSCLPRCSCGVPSRTRGVHPTVCAVCVGPFLQRPDHGLHDSSSSTELQSASAPESIPSQLWRETAYPQSDDPVADMVVSLRHGILCVCCSSCLFFGLPTCLWCWALDSPAAAALPDTLDSLVGVSFGTDARSS